MENQEYKSTFLCYKCKEETAYNPNDYFGKELFLEMKTYPSKPKIKEVIINCSNPKCNADNIITITY